MADVPPIPPSNPNPLPGAPTGAEPLKKSTGKVQPKKETVRINLPPKPTAAPTIKLPTLPPGGPTGAPSIAPFRAAAPPPSAPALATAPKTAAAPTAAPTAAKAPAPLQRAAAPVVPAIKTIDKVLIYSALVASFAAVGMVGWMWKVLNDTVTNFNS